MSIDAVFLSDKRHVIVVLSGHAEAGCETSLRETLCSSERQHRGHTIVDLRHVDGLTPQAVKALLWALGRALDRGRTLRLVVRDTRQRRFLEGLGLKGMMPLHDSIAEAMAAVDESLGLNVHPEHDDQFA